MLHVAGTSFPPLRSPPRSPPSTPPRSPWLPPAATTGSRRRLRPLLPGCFTPALSATVLTVFILHLLLDLASRLRLADLGGVLSILVGMAAVLVILLPFTLHCARRAQEAWSGRDGGRRVASRPSAGAAGNPG